MIVELLATSFFAGIILGVIEAWNKKVSFVIWLGAVIYTLVILIKGESLSFTPELGISNWWWIPFIALMIIGSELGESIYESTFKGK